jgi:hypothetical protein
MNTVRRLTVNQVKVINHSGRHKDVEVEASAVDRGGSILASIKFHTTHTEAPRSGDQITVTIAWDNTKETS